MFHQLLTSSVRPVPIPPAGRSRCLRRPQCCSPTRYTNGGSAGVKPLALSRREISAYCQCLAKAATPFGQLVGPAVFVFSFQLGFFAPPLYTLFARRIGNSLERSM